MITAAELLVKCLENEGVEYIAEDADVDDMLPLLAKGGFYHAGQVRVYVQRVFVHESLFDQVSYGLVEYGKKMKYGDPADGVYRNWSIDTSRRN